MPWRPQTCSLTSPTHMLPRPPGQIQVTCVLPVHRVLIRRNCKSLNCRGSTDNRHGGRNMQLIKTKRLQATGLNLSRTKIATVVKRCLLITIRRMNYGRAVRSEGSRGACRGGIIGKKAQAPLAAASSPVTNCILNTLGMWE